jgi:hypothetical protein
VTYNDHIRFFEQELQRVGKPPFDLSAQSFLQVLEQEPTREADDACRVFAATLEWPPLREAVRLEVCLRLACARDWCEAVTGAPGDDEEDGRQFLEELLTEYWRDYQREWLGKRFVFDKA